MEQLTLFKSLTTVYVQTVAWNVCFFSSCYLCVDRMKVNLSWRDLRRIIIRASACERNDNVCYQEISMFKSVIFIVLLFRMLLALELVCPKTHVPFLKIDYRGFCFSNCNVWKCNKKNVRVFYSCFFFTSFCKKPSHLNENSML